jgi:hypothetical protein
MAKLDEDIYLEHIPSTVHGELVYELNRNSNWQVLARYVAEELGYEW